MRLIDVHYLQECLIFKILIGGKSCNFISLYRSPSQSSDSFEEFADNLQLLLDKNSNQNPFLTVVLGDFNTKSSNWYKHDQTTYEGTKINAVTSQFSLQQLIKKLLSKPSHGVGRLSLTSFKLSPSTNICQINEMVFLFNRTIKNILSNHIPHEIIICDDRDPTWINNRVKELINEKNDNFQCFLHSNKDPRLFNKVE